MTKELAKKLATDHLHAARIILGQAGYHTLAREVASVVCLVNKEDDAPLKTIAEIWDEVPHGQAITDPDYLALCTHLENKAARTIDQMAREIPGLWDMTCAGATLAVNQWAEREEERNPGFLEEYKAELRKRF